MNIITIPYISRQIINTTIAEHVVSNDTFGTPTIYKKLVIQTNLILNKVSYIVIYNHNNKIYFNDILEAVIEYNKYT